MKLTKSLRLSNGIVVPRGTVLNFGNESFANYKGHKVPKVAVEATTPAIGVTLSFVGSGEAKIIDKDMPKVLIGKYERQFPKFEMDNAKAIHAKMPTYAIKHKDGKVTLIGEDTLLAKLKDNTVKVL